MKNHVSAFERFHPTALFLHLASVILTLMFCRDSFFAISAFTAAAVFIALRHERIHIFGYLLVVLIITVINPLISHNGSTPLLFINGRAFTLEAVLFGFVTGMIIVAVLLWCRVSGLCFGTDKFIYIFGKALPKLSLLISMTVRLIPELKRNFRRIYDNGKQFCPAESRGWFPRVRYACGAFSALVTCALEGAAERSISMRSRGFGIGRRTSFSIYKFHSRDIILIAFTLAFSCAYLTPMMSGSLSTEYYPAFSPPDFDAISVCAYAAFTLLCFIPAISELKENIRWKYFV